MKSRFAAIVRIVMFLIPAVVRSQEGSGVKVTPNQQGGVLLDSVTSTPYPYIFPLLGKKVASKGFMLPYPLGIMVNSFLGRQDVVISDLTVGVVDAGGSEVIPTTPLDQVVGFGQVRANVYNINARADVWVLPFLDVYGIVGGAWLTTHVDINTIMQQEVDISTQAKFNGYVYGVGGMLTGGIHSAFGSLDFNTVWTHFRKMESKNVAMNLSFRGGYVVHFRKPERNMAFWAGAGRTFLNNTTRGSISLADVAPDFGQNYQTSDWYTSLTPVQQELADRVAQNFIDENKGDVINYSLDKRPSHNWAMILGAQYQHSRRWQFRTEVNLLGGRASALLSANYRFGIR